MKTWTWSCTVCPINSRLSDVRWAFLGRAGNLGDGTDGTLRSLKFQTARDQGRIGRDMPTSRSQRFTILEPAPCLRMLDPTATRWIVPTESFTAPEHAAGLLVVSYRAGPCRCEVRVLSFLLHVERAPVSLLLSECVLGRIPQSRASAQGALQA